MNNEQLKTILKHVYKLVIRTKLDYRRDKFEIDARSKIKNLSLALTQFDDPRASFLHFIKYACYFLPRSNLHKGDTDFMTPLLEAIEVIEKNSKNGSSYQDELEQLSYLVGYTAWTLDALVEIFNSSKESSEVEKKVHTMLKTEFSLLEEEIPTEITNKIMGWYKKAKDRRR